ncbi:hypothetical protein ACLB2K_004602 [Fragaria x ananassa]
MTISLRDFTYICGLPITGRFYDEVVPSIEEFSAKGRGGEPIIPKSCRSLFLAYHNLCKDDKGQKNTYNPSGEIHEVKARTDDDSALFDDLGVDDEDIESTYLAAFYGCWLCLFVFPMDDTGLIRPIVFIVASKMSQGLNEISASKDPGNCPATLPFHYVYTWLTEYFDTYFYSPLFDSFKPCMVHFSGEFSAKHFRDAQARSLFTAFGNVGMDILAIVPKERKVIVDRENVNSLDIVYLTCL